MPFAPGRPGEHGLRYSMGESTDHPGGCAARRSERSGRSLDWPGGEVVKTRPRPAASAGAVDVMMVMIHPLIRSRIHQDWLYSRSADEPIRVRPDDARCPPGTARERRLLEEPDDPGLIQPALDLGRSKVGESTEILIVTRTLLENASLTMKEMVHLVAEAVEVSDFLIGEIHLRSCSKFGVVRIASAFHGSGARSHLALDQ